MIIFRNVMTFLTLFTKECTMSAAAFIPARRLLATKISSSGKEPHILTQGLRRRRKGFTGDSCMAYVETMQRDHNKYRDIQYGALLDPNLMTATSTEKSILAELPTVFPLAGKNPREEPPRMRFAPSPTGSLHVGGARTALYNWLVAKKGQLDHPDSEASFILRVEDTDVARSTKESEDSVVEDLAWLGLKWDEGPEVVGCKYGPYRQSERTEIYFTAAMRLLESGNAYRCFCTEEELEQMKAEQEARGEVGRYDGRWRDADEAEVTKRIDAGDPFTVRFKVPDNARVVIDDVVRGTIAWDAHATVGDFILLRSSGVPVYNFCVAVDDASMGVTTVVRAEEHLTNTVRQALVLDALNAPRPQYAHCSLILGEDKQKLSKRHGATSCNQYRLDGFLPDAMINYLALLGWNDGTDNEIFTRDELIDAFELNRVVKSPSVFDLEKLKWVNSQHLKMKSIEELVPLVKYQMELEGMLKENVDVDSQQMDDFATAATSLAKQMMQTTKDAALNAKKVLGYALPENFTALKDLDAKNMIEQGYFYLLAKKVIEQYEAGEFPTPDIDPLAAFQDAVGQAIEEDSQKGATCQYTLNYMAHMKAFAKELGVKGKDFFHPVRLMLTGEMSGQDVTKQLSLLAMATFPDSVIDNEKVALVEFSERIVRLKSFCSTIPEKFREPHQIDNASQTNNVETSATSREDYFQKADTINVDPKDSYSGPPISALDIRVGLITKVWEHEEADKLYCEEIEVGEDEPRQVASGLRPYLTSEALLGRKVLVLCNLKERKLVGFPSHGMVLCASNKDHSVVRLVNPPIDAKVGERVTVPDFDYESNEGAPFAENKIGKKKIFEEISSHLVTNKYGVPEFLGRPLMTSAGVCTSPIAEGTVS